MDKELLNQQNINKATSKGLKKQLALAKTNKNDEFYTRIEDIEKELIHYKEHFKGKKIYLNCDNPEWSNFWKYFYNNFNLLGISALLSTHYSQDGKPSYILQAKKNETGEIIFERKELKGNGDFRSEESVSLLQQADIVVTNPPFSLFREYLSQLMTYNKKFIIVGNNNAITYKELFKYIKTNEIWLGRSGMIQKFIMEYNNEHSKYNNFKGKLLNTKEDGTQVVEEQVGVGCWFTNVGTPADREEFSLTTTYKGNEYKYPKYDNYEAINVNKGKDIPNDYYGVMGVPITFLHKLNTNQFEILGITKNWDDYDERFSDPYVNGKALYARLLIRKIK